MPGSKKAAGVKPGEVYGEIEVTRRDPGYAIGRSRQMLRGYDWLTIVPQELATTLGGADALDLEVVVARLQQQVFDNHDYCWPVDPDSDSWEPDWPTTMADLTDADGTPAGRPSLPRPAHRTGRHHLTEDPSPNINDRYSDVSLTPRAPWLTPDTRFRHGRQCRRIVAKDLPGAADCSS